MLHETFQRSQAQAPQRSGISDSAPPRPDHRAMRGNRMIPVWPKMPRPFTDQQRSMSDGISLTTNKTNFREWGAASPEDFIVPFIRVHSCPQCVVQKFSACARPAHSNQATQQHSNTATQQHSNTATHKGGTPAPLSKNPKVSGLSYDIFFSADGSLPPCRFQRRSATQLAGAEDGFSAGLDGDGVCPLTRLDIHFVAVVFDAGCSLNLP